MAAKLSPENQRLIAGLQQEVAGVEKEEAKLSAVYTALTQEEGRLKATDDLLKGAVKNHKAKIEVHNGEVAQSQAAIGQHNSRCAGASSDAAFVARCNSEAGTLNARRTQLDNQATTINMMGAGLNDRIKDLTDGTLKWAQKKKTYNAQTNDLAAKKTALESKIRRIVMNPSFLNDLKLREKISTGCAKIANDMAAWRCMERVFDGRK